MIAYTFRLHIHTRGVAFTVDARKELAACLRRIAADLESAKRDVDVFHPNQILDSTRADCGRWFLRREME